MAKKAYIAGKVTGMMRHKASMLFGSLQKRLMDKGYETIVPLDIVDKDMDWSGAMRVCIIALLSCDEIHLLPNWRESKGARIEHDLAKSLGMPIIYYNDTLTGYSAEKQSLPIYK